MVAQTTEQPAYGRLFLFVLFFVSIRLGLNDSYFVGTVSSGVGGGVVSQ